MAIDFRNIGTWALAGTLGLVLLAGCQSRGRRCEALPDQFVPQVEAQRHADPAASSARCPVESSVVPIGGDPSIGSVAATPTAGGELRLVRHEAESQAAPARSLDLTLDEAIAVSLDRNPTLITLRAAEPVAHAVYHVAETYPWNPFVQLQVLPYAHDRFGERLAVNNYVYLIQTLELAHQQRHREDSAAAAWRQVRWNIVQAELTNVAQTERLYFTALYQRELRDLAVRTASLNEELLGIVERRFTAALATAADRTNSQVAARQSRKQAALAEMNFQTSVLALRRQLNVSDDAPLALVGRLEDFAWLSVADRGRSSPGEGSMIKIPDELVAEWALERPDVLAAGAGVSTAQANANLARANRIPNTGIGPFYERDEAGTVFAGLRSQLNVPVWDTGRPLVEQREAELRQQLTTLRQLRARAKVEAKTAVERYELARRLTPREGDVFARTVPEDLRRIKELFEAGQADILTVYATQNSLLQEQRTHLDSLNELAQAAADVTLNAGLPPARLVTTSSRRHPNLERLPPP
jgi:outer membrane protein, heavy metal efflux system